MKEIFIERKESLLRIGIRENEKLVESIVEENKNEPIIGEIYKARVKKILPAINSIFVDLGLNKEGYLYYSEELKSTGIKKGEDILVEVVKEPINDKGAKLTTKVSIPGKYAVLNCYDKGIHFSKRIVDEEKKKEILENLQELNDVGITIRTEAIYADSETLKNEINRLYNEFLNINKSLKYSTQVKKIYGEDLSLFRILRNTIGQNPVKIYADNKEDFEKIKDFSKDESNVVLELYSGMRNIFDFYGLEKELLKLRHNKVNLPCGGYIVIDKTEAMYVIDVNSGKNIKGRSFDKTILETNLEAAKEIGNQVKVRNLSGIIVIDFIDMRDKSQKNIVMRALEESFSSDKGNTKIFKFTELDLVQISRRRQGKSIYEYMEEDCMTCNGHGRILKLFYIQDLIKNEILRIKEDNTISSFYIEIDNVYKERIKGDLFNFLKEIDCLDKEIYLNYIENMEGFKIEPLIFQSQKVNLEKYKITQFDTI
ncbi:Rne/Rng family ribonuclease [Clostridium sp. CMCC3677]|uniref:Rne/Rng family ribonuclease n=1 Tax=Clostridium sp. CMCC3677 TaxID=2949963 RepID=UPI0013F0C8C5|nr:Rne/Rng family ribonuclease [Clostridium sp. CMCC3677]NFG61217.1 Rne/Rng family ribonuclease [Clostridium botulinum]NFQ08963.1 Rne/Rng family ribonuclease [Clostridium botulinum]